MILNPLMAYCESIIIVKSVDWGIDCRTTSIAANSPTFQGLLP